MSNTTHSHAWISTRPWCTRRKAGREPSPLIEGSVSAGFEPVREAFIENFTRRGELGAACCIYQDGEKVVDLWGGVRDRASGEPWREDTMVVVHSTTKGLAAMVMALAHSRGWLDYDERVCDLLARVRAERQGARSPSVSSSPIRRGCSHSTSRSTATSSRTSIGWPTSWPGSGRPGSRASGRPITRSASASTRAS